MGILLRKVLYFFLFFGMIKEKREVRSWILQPKSITKKEARLW